MAAAQRRVMQAYSDSIFPSAIGDLNATKDFINQVVDLSKEKLRCMDGTEEEVVETQTYVQEAMEAVVSNIHCISAHVTQFLLLQDSNMEDLNTKMKVLKSRMELLRSHKQGDSTPGTTPTTTPTTGSKAHAIVKLTGDALPECAKPLVPRTFESIQDRLDNLCEGHQSRRSLKIDYDGFHVDHRLNSFESINNTTTISRSSSVKSTITEESKQEEYRDVSSAADAVDEIKEDTVAPPSPSIDELQEDFVPPPPPPQEDEEVPPPPEEHEDIPPPPPASTPPPSSPVERTPPTSVPPPPPEED